MTLADVFAPLPLREAERLVARAIEQQRLEREPAERLAASLRDPRVRACVLEGARASRDRGKGREVSFSRNFFLPLTNLCRNRCSYCTFAKSPRDPEARSFALDEVSEQVEAALRAGCTELLFCLGDKPELAHRSYREWLAAQGFTSTADYLVEACRIAFEAGVLPHTNAGLLTAEQMERLRPWNASLGLMLETTSARLRRRGQAHFGAPDKEPELRLRMHREAGEIGIAFTTGMLLGIGETEAERVDTLFAIRELADRYGHIQETIVQPFHPKPGTPMGGVAPLEVDEVEAWAALARLVLGPQMNLQVPPNLAPRALEGLLAAGVNDWGGVSPLTIDFINPEAPWPTLEALRERTEAAGYRLRERLPAYPEFVRDRPDLFDPRVHAALRRLADAEGYARPRRWREEEAA